jgi:hypothetical protein
LSAGDDIAFEMRPWLSSRYTRATGLALLFLVAILPTLLVDIPAMEDYLEHLARMYILTATGTPDANPFYPVTWTLLADIAMDLIVPQLARLFDVEIAAKVFFLVSQLLIFSGAIAIELAVKRRHQTAGIAALAALYSAPFCFGFSNFEFGTGIALWGVASWIVFERQAAWIRFSVHCGFVCLLFVSHFFALGIYGLTIGLYELRRLFRDRFPLARTTAITAMLATPVLILLLVIHYIGSAVGGTQNRWLFTWKPVWVALFMNGYNIFLGAASAATLIVLLVYLRFKRSLVMSADGKWIGVGFLLVFLVMPQQIFDSRMADIRMLTAALLILPAFLTFSPSTKSLGYVTAFVVAGIIFVNISYTTYVWLSYRSDYAALKASFTRLPRGSFVLVGQSSLGDVPATLLTDVPIHRAPSLAVHYANAFVSSMYTFPGQNPVRVRPDLKRLEVDSKTETYIPPSLTTLRLLAKGKQVAEAPSYARSWVHDFDYVYLVGPRVDEAMPGVLEELTSSRRFTLYRVLK